MDRLALAVPVVTEETAAAGATRFGRAASGAISALGFFVLLYILSSALFLSPFAVVFHAAMFASWPVIMTAWLKGSQISGVLLWVAMVAPYPLIGLVLGVLWPLGRPLFWRAVWQMAVRLAITMALLIVPGFLAYLASSAH